VSPAELAFVLVAAFAGTVLQGSLGFGFALLAVPALLLVAPAALPVTSLLLAVPMVVTMALRERGAIDLPGFWRMTVGRVPGTVVGAWALVALGADAATALVGALLIAAVLASVLASAVVITPGTQVAAGFVSGVMSTTGAIGGPALGLAYQGRPGPELRSTLALAFAVGVALSLASLGVAGEVRGEHLVWALELLPAMALGLWVSRFTAPRLDGRWLRPAVLAFGGTAGVAALVRALLGA
jgi:uncharacterized membrane protein YfcA